MLKSYTAADFPAPPKQFHRDGLAVSIGANGCFVFKLSVSQALGMKAGDSIRVLQDTDARDSWYIEKNQNGPGPKPLKQDGFVLEETNLRRVKFRCYGLARKLILDTLGDVDFSTVRFPLVRSFENPDRLAFDVKHAVITISAKRKKK